MKTNSKVRAFSLIELSIVILIIGILIAGVTQGSRILSQAKLNNARTLTKSSPVSSIKNLAFWIDSTSEESFPDASTEDGQEITTWYDLNPQTGSKSNLTGTTGSTPLYKTNIINGLPAAYFAGTDEFMSASAFTNIVTNSSTVFLVVKLPDTLPSAPAAILSKRATTTTLSSPNIQVSFDGGNVGQAWQYCDGAGASTDDSICNEISTNDDVAASTPYVVSLVFISNTADGGSTTTSTGIHFFQNGVASGTSATNDVTNGAPDTTGAGALFLGQHGATTATEAFFNGYVGEVIIFDRNLKKEERQAVEAYLGKKWGVAMTTESF